MNRLTWKNVFLTLLGTAFVSAAGLYATGMGGFAAVAGAIAITFLLCAAWVTGAIAIALLLMAAWVWIVQLRRERGDECCDLEGWEEVGPDDQDTQD